MKTPKKIKNVLYVEDNISYFALYHQLYIPIKKNGIEYIYHDLGAGINQIHCKARIHASLINFEQCLELLKKYVKYLKKEDNIFEYNGQKYGHTYKLITEKKYKSPAVWKKHVPNNFL